MQPLWSAVIGTALRVYFLHINSYTIRFVISKPSRWQKVQGFLISILLFPANYFKVYQLQVHSNHTTGQNDLILQRNKNKWFGDLVFHFHSISNFLKYNALVAVFQCLAELQKNPQRKIKCWFVNTEMIQYLIKYLWNWTTINSTTQLIKKRPLYIHNLHSENIEITFCLYHAALKTSLGFYIQSSYLAPRYKINKLKTHC